MIACATIVKDERVLLVQHSGKEKSDYGYWLLPAGSVEPHETIDEAVQREVKEETGLKVRIVRRLTEIIDPYTKDRLVNFLCTTLQSEIRISSELKKAKWFAEDEISDLTNVHPELKKFLIDGLTTHKFSPDKGFFVVGWMKLAPQNSNQAKHFFDQRVSAKEVVLWRICQNA
jgi:8-oxo-dGTP diphosphatase